MGKIVAALMVVFFIEVALVFFSGYTGTTTYLYQMLMNPVGWQGTVFYILFLAVLSGSALAVIVPSAFYQVNQWALFAIAGVTMITFIGNIAHLWGFLNGQLVGIFSDATMGGLIATLITAPLFIFYMVAMLEWSRANN